MPDLSSYLAKVTSQHRGRPRFIASLTAALEPLVAAQAFIRALPAAFDLDEAVGAQLDIVGLWVGRSRYVAVPLPNVFFSFDTEGLGLDEANWRNPFDPDSGLSALDNFNYRLLLKAVIASNHWNGMMVSAQQVLSGVFAELGAEVVVEDLQNMSMVVAVTNAPPTAVLRALLAGGYIPFKPAGVRVDYLVPSAPGPLFAFDVETNALAGFDAGIWAEPA